MNAPIIPTKKTLKNLSSEDKDNSEKKLKSSKIDFKKIWDFYGGGPEDELTLYPKCGQIWVEEMIESSESS